MQARIIYPRMLSLAMPHRHPINCRTTGERLVCSKLKVAANGPYIAGGRCGLQCRDTVKDGAKQVSFGPLQP